MKLKFIIDKEYDLFFARSKQEKVYIEEQYSKNRKYLVYSRGEYQISWDKINDAFSAYIEKTTGHPWKHKTYYCVISAAHEGISNWGDSNRIIRWWKDNPFTQRRITAHELIISHYFTIIKSRYSDAKLDDKKIWILAEIAAFALTSLTPEAKEFWPWDRSGYYFNHNYPEIVYLQKKMRTVFLKQKNFDGYIKKGIAAVNGS